MYAYITGFVICVPKLLCQMETSFVKLRLLPCWVLYFLLTFYLGNYCLDETCHSHIWLYTFFFFFLFLVWCSRFFTAFVWYRHGFKKGTKLAGLTGSTGNRPSIGRLWAKTENDLKLREFENRAVQLENWEPA